MTYKQALNYLYGLQKYGVKFGLSKTSNIMKKMGNPHKGQNYIHVAGTNGKGSVSAMVESVLMRSGLKVGFYSSPHLVRFTERFRINRKEISKKKVIELTEEIKGIINPAEPPTYFEVTTAMALAYFARENTDIAIMEVGMGGRLDATNIIKPLVSAITNISLEHQFFLGNTLVEIAGEKAGIIKKGINTISAATQPKVSRLFREVCEERKAPFFQVGKDVRYRSSDNGFNYYGLNRRIRDINLTLKGEFQHRNTALAIGILELLEKKGYRFEDQDIKAGVEETTWTGRIQVLAERPLIVVDGAHNPGASRALVEAVKKDFSYKRLILVLGVMKDKDIGSIVREIAGMADHIVCSSPEYFRSATPEDLYKIVSTYNKNTEMIKTLPEAIKKAKKIARSDDMILITGSLFTVGEALTAIDPIKYKPDGV
ncbi:MAG: folylpolyglutamate synthase/dihydrofolate synthase family protein [Desulfobacteraceae bacterium]